ncbi:phosphomannomutase/phosphoglucomutase [Amycolatopsis acidiphila]|uniref:Phosphomannomutase/phosphoglucomutase n=1 Tax=Amycolatopsis acidiphila TaxID=715473 RepID=A0A557ZXA2_9PSEU|nr:phosphomannomutase/phosphoglucomutase [Amycolatopsis acidiphila]TVT16620.1 phosphomannomutase/phosphoglucomutase [Amycolatopsis acidiphila]UIJ58908.1 phosphomannomutase/phosphoglucomutase [Amycolatopsis acidiphila]GHG72712.1 phosphomannomutase/phosphoglucomutase [Amycolatopsis acidiphila]
MSDLSAIVKAYDIRGVVGEQLNADLVRNFGAAFALLIKPESPAVVIGHDMRESSPGLAQAFAEGVTSQGLDVVHIGLASTDELYFASGSLNLAGAQFTASHNPAKYNGIKMCRPGAAPVGQDSGLAEIRDTVEQGVPAFEGQPGTVTERDVLTDYAAYLRGLVDLSRSRPLKVVVDAGNGMGGHTVPTVFEGLPIDLVPMYFELDGSFPNHEANPLDPRNLVDLQAKVREVGADAGLAFDGDADRCFVIDENGDPVSPSAITALVATRELAKEPGATIIHNLITSHAVPEIVTEHGGKPVRTRVGHSFIKEEMARTGAIFGGEHSAHYYFRDFWRADTGMLAAMHVLAALGEQDGPLSELTREYKRYAASGEVNSTVDDQVARQLAVKDAFAGRAGVLTDELDGLTVQLPDGSWFNLRPSNTEPLLRLNVEAPTEDAVRALTDEVLAIVRG